MADFNPLLDAIRQRRSGVAASGYRTPERNAEVGGASNSYHMQRDAAGNADANDITWQGINWDDVKAVANDPAIRDMAQRSGWELVSYTHGTGPHLHVEPAPRGQRVSSGGGSVAQVDISALPDALGNAPAAAAAPAAPQAFDITSLPDAAAQERRYVGTIVPGDAANMNKPQQGGGAPMTLQQLLQAQQQGGGTDATLSMQQLLQAQGAQVGRVTPQTLTTQAQAQQRAAETAQRAAANSTLFGQIRNANDRGAAQAALAYTTLAQAGGTDVFDAMAEANRTLRDIPEAPGMQRFMAADGFTAALGRFAENPQEVLIGGAIPSLSAYMRMLPATATTGAVIGAGVGSAAPGIGTLAGAALGATAGSVGASSLLLDYSGTLMEELAQRGVDVTNADALRRAFADPKVANDARRIALAKGLPVALVDQLTAGFAGSAMRATGTSGLAGRALGAFGEFALQAGGGMTGEAASQFAANVARGMSPEQAARSVSAPDVLIEGLAEMPTAVPEAATNIAARRQEQQQAASTPAQPAQPGLAAGAAQATATTAAAPAVAAQPAAPLTQPTMSQPVATNVAPAAENVQRAAEQPRISEQESPAVSPDAAIEQEFAALERVLSAEATPEQIAQVQRLRDAVQQRQQQPLQQTLNTLQQQLQTLQEQVSGAAAATPQQVQAAVAAQQQEQQRQQELAQVPEQLQQRDASEVFEQNVLQKASEIKFKSRSRIINMPISDFLSLATQLAPEQDKAASIAEARQRGEKLREIPMLDIADEGNGVARVMSHEGRHRARQLLAEGYTTMPVEITSDSIRWYAQNNPQSIDYVEDYPTQLRTEDGKSSIPFPITREQSSIPSPRASQRGAALVGMGIPQLVDRVAQSQTVQEIRTAAAELGRRVYAAGSTTYNTWRTAMRQALGNAWQRVAPVLRQVWRDVQTFARDEAGTAGQGRTEAQAQQRGMFAPQDIAAALQRADQQQALARDIENNYRPDDINNRYEQNGGLSDFFSGIIIPISTRLGYISQGLRRALRNFEFNNIQRQYSDLQAANPWMKKYAALSAQDKDALDLALKNSDVAAAQAIMGRNGMAAEYAVVQQILDRLRNDAIEMGYDVGFIPDYFPRSISDSRGLTKELYGYEERGAIRETIRKREQAIGRTLTEEEKAEVANSVIRGYGNALALSGPSNIKGRKLLTLTPELNKYYTDSTVALTRYITRMNEAIEARRFFGKGNDIDGSIGRYVANLVEQNAISPAAENEAIALLRARFGMKPMTGGAASLRDVGYITTMGNVLSAITQIGDLYSSVYMTGLRIDRPIVNVLRAMIGQSNITTKDIGIDRIAQEYAKDPTMLSRALDSVFKWSGLTAMDKLGKETLINTTIDRFRREARNGRLSPRMEQRLRNVFGDETAQVMDDLRSGRTTENVKLLAFNTLLDFQPVALSEMPRSYLTAPNGRIFYMLKTYAIKQLDVLRREGLDAMVNGHTPAQKMKGFTSMMYLAFLMMAANMGADEIKDKLLGRDTPWDDMVIDNILRLFGVSKYVIYKARGSRTPAREVIISTVAPPASVIEYPITDLMGFIKKGSDYPIKDMQTLQLVPYFGKFYHWWFGAGRGTIERREGKQLRSSREENKVLRTRNISRDGGLTRRNTTR